MRLRAIVGFLAGIAFGVAAIVYALGQLVDIAPDCPRATKEAAVAEAKAASDAFVLKWDAITVHDGIAECGRWVEPLQCSPGTDTYPTAAFHCVDGRCHVAFLTRVRGYNEVITTVTMWPHYEPSTLACSRCRRVLPWPSLSYCRRTAPDRSCR